MDTFKINKRVTLKPHKKYLDKNIKGTIISKDDGDCYLVEWDEPVQGNNPNYYRHGWYILEDLIFLDRELKLKRILNENYIKS